MSQYGRSGLGGIPPVVKNLLIINVIFYIGTVFLYPALFEKLSMHFVLSEAFQPFQIITHMFMHSQFGFMHILFNMFALWMFGSPLERVWGPQKFLTFYLITGLGAIGLHTLVTYIEFQSLTSALSSIEIQTIVEASRYEAERMQPNFQKIWMVYNGEIVGASGAIYGLLVAFGMLFPNTPLMLIFFPVPIKAKYFIPILMVIELTMGVGQFRWDNIAHFAHLGGALFGFIIVMIWKKNRTTFY